MVEGPVVGSMRQPRWWHPLTDLLSRFYYRHLRYWIPHLVWRGQEVDVRVTFTENRLQPILIGSEADLSRTIRQLNNGVLGEVERKFHDIGINFDKGLGHEGRDWEWDWSLEGPVHVTFVSRAKRPDRRGG